MKQIVLGTSKYSFVAILQGVQIFIKMIAFMAPEPCCIIVKQAQCFACQIWACLLPHLAGLNARQKTILPALFAFNLRQNPKQSMTLTFRVKRMYQTLGKKTHQTFFCVPRVFRDALLLTLLSLSYSLVCSYAEDLDKMRDTISYGTDSEISSLLKTVKSGKITELDDDLRSLAIRSKNEMITNALFSYFTDGEKTGLEDKAIGILEKREENEKTAVSAIEYLGTVKEKKAKDILQEIISKDESAYINSAVKALGKIAKEMGSGVSDDTAEYLIAYYTDKSPKLDTCREIIIALGSTGSQASLDFLCKIVDDEDEESSYLKTASLIALGEIKDQGTLETILKAAQSTDGSVKSAAVAALGGFNDAKADEAIIDAFRDSFFRTRLAAVKASGERKLASSIPYLRYRAINDDAASVRDESILVLGAMNNSDAGKTLLEILDDKKINDKVRISCAQALLKNDASIYCERIIELTEEAKAKKYTMLYAGLLKALSAAKTAKLQDFTARLFTSKDVTDNAIALDITANNSFGNFKDEVKRISETKNSTLAARAQKILSSL